MADRWHLLHGLALGLEEFLLGKRPALGRAAAPVPGEEEGLPPGSIDGDVSTLPIRLGRPYDSVEGPAERRASVLDPYLPYLLKRWNEGCRSAKRLHGEIREMGYRHSVETVNRLLSSFRYTETQGKEPSHVQRAKRGSIAGASPTAKNVAALLMRREEMLNEEQKEYLGRLRASDRALADARRLTQDFAGMVRNLEGEKLDGWLEEAGRCEASAMKKFAAGLKKDLPAVRARLTEEWSNGPVKGFVNKLKLVKPQGYGRAGFDLLRARVLAA